MANTPTPLATTPQTAVLASSSMAPTVVPPMDFDIDQIMNDFPQAEIVDYHETQRDQVVSPSESSKALVIYKSKAEDVEKLQERLEEVVVKVVREMTNELIELADAEMSKEQKVEEKKEEASDSTKEQDELMTETPQQAPTDHESPKITETTPAVTRRQAQPVTKLVAQIPDVSFEIPDEVQVDDDTINQLVPMDEALRRITTQSGKKYSFYDRLQGWKLECRLRLNGSRQYDKYYTHLQSKTVTRSVPEVLRFVLYEVNPKQMREVNKKRKMEQMQYFQERPETSSENTLLDEDLSTSFEDTVSVLADREELYIEMWLRVAWENLNNSTAIAAPSEERWEEMKAAKRRAKTAGCKPGDCAPKSDVEAANALIGLAEEESEARKRQKASN